MRPGERIENLETPAKRRRVDSSGFDYCDNFLLVTLNAANDRYRVFLQVLMKLHKPKTTTEVISMEMSLFEVAQKEWDNMEPTGQQFSPQVQKDVRTFSNYFYIYLEVGEGKKGGWGGDGLFKKTCFPEGRTFDRFTFFLGWPICVYTEKAQTSNFQTRFKLDATGCR